jgi:hypothetical protein
MSNFIILGASIDEHVPQGFEIEVLLGTILIFVLYRLDFSEVAL